MTSITVRRLSSPQGGHTASSLNFITVTGRETNQRPANPKLAPGMILKIPEIPGVAFRPQALSVTIMNGSMGPDILMVWSGIDSSIFSDNPGCRRW
jgi:hypothetical protein